MSPGTTDIVSEISSGRWLLLADTLELPRQTSLSRARPGWLEAGVALLERRRLLARATALALGLGLVYSLLLPNRYQASTQLLPPQANQSAVAAVLAPFGELAGLAGKDLVKNPSALYVTLLRSRSVADRLIARFSLMGAYRQADLFGCREALKKNTGIETTKEGVIIIQVEDQDPGRAAALANGYVEELVRLNQSLAVGEASRRRRFFEDQLHSTSLQLTQSEDELEALQQKNGMIQVDAQAKILLESLAALRVRIVAQEARLQAERFYKENEHPEIVQAREELKGLKEELSRLQQEGDPALNPVPTSRLPAASLEYLRRLREVKYREAVFELLAKQLEAARLDEAKEGGLIQVIDPAEVPRRKSGPHRWLIAGVVGLLGLALVGAGVITGAWWSRLAADAERGAALARLKQALGRAGAGA